MSFTILNTGGRQNNGNTFDFRHFVECFFCYDSSSNSDPNVNIYNHRTKLFFKEYSEIMH